MKPDINFVNMFLDEATDTLEDWDRCCDALAAVPDQDKLNALFRAAHNLKGSSRSVGLLEFGGFVHEIEFVISSVKEGRAPCDSRTVAFFRAAGRALEAWIEGCRGDCLYKLPAALHSSILSQASSLASARQDGIAQDEPAADHGSGAEDCAEDGIFFNLDMLESHLAQSRGDEGFTVPPAQHAASEPAQATASGKVSTSTSASSQAAQGAPPNGTPGKSSKPDETIRVSTERVDRLIRVIGEVAIQVAIINHERLTSQNWGSLPSNITSSGPTTIRSRAKTSRCSRSSRRFSSTGSSMESRASTSPWTRSTS